MLVEGEVYESGDKRGRVVRKIPKVAPFVVEIAR